MTEAEQLAPIPMLLWCPGCGERHLDVGEFATREHHSHACQHCGHVWRPAIVPTVGVQFLPGFKNEPPAQHTGEHGIYSPTPGCTCTYEEGDSDCIAHPTCLSCGADYTGALLDEVKRLKSDLALSRGLHAAVDDALNSGDGSYKP